MEGAAPDGARLFIGEKGEVQGRPPTCLHEAIIWPEGFPGCRKNSFGWDTNQTSINDEPQGETGENFPVREGTRSGEPKASDAAQRGRIGKQ